LVDATIIKQKKDGGLVYRLNTVYSFIESNYLFILAVILFLAIVVSSMKYIVWFRHFTKGGK
jgi:hypothetical protein